MKSREPLKPKDEWTSTASSDSDEWATELAPPSHQRGPAWLFAVLLALALVIVAATHRCSIVVGGDAAMEVPTPAVATTWVAPTTAPTAAASVLDTGFAMYPEDTRVLYGRLTPLQKQLFMEIYQGCLIGSQCITLSQTATPADFEAAIQTIFFDCPELFMLSDQYTCVQNAAGEVRQVKLQYTLTPEQYEAQLEQVMNVIRMLAFRQGFATGEYERELAIYEALLESCQYDAEQPFCGMANAAWLYGYAKCSGYTRALHLALRYYGIACLEVEGSIDSTDTGKEEPHMWSCLRINDRWYQADATSDDCEESAQAPMSNNPKYLPYFNLPTEWIMEGRRVSDEQQWLPICDSVEDNYYQRQSLIIPAGADLQKVVTSAMNIALQNGQTAYAFFFSETDDREQMLQSLSSLVSAWGKGQKKSCSYRYQYGDGDRVIYLYDLCFR